MTGQQMIEARHPREHYWLWPLLRVFHDDLGWLVVGPLRRRTVRLAFGKAARPR